MIKIVATACSVVVSLVLATLLPAQSPSPYGPPVPKAKGKAAPKKKGEREPGADVRKAYDLLRRLRADVDAAARPDERLRNWIDRASDLYREALRAQAGGDVIRAREYSAAAHDLARAVDHARNAIRYDRPDPGLPAPAGEFGVGDTRDRAFRDLYRAYERLAWLGTWQPSPRSEIYVNAAHDLYNAGRRDLEAGRDERAGELARAAEAMTHVPEHLAQIANAGAVGRPALPPPPPERADPKAKRVVPPGDGATGILPPILPPR